MPNYTNFDQVLNDRKLSESAKTEFVRRWLDRTYGIDYNANEGFFAEVTRVHDHDNQPKHFGQVMLQNSLGAVGVQVVKDPTSKKWRLGLAFADAADQLLLLYPVNANERNETVEQFKDLLAAPAVEQRIARPGNSDSQYGDLEAYRSSNLTDEDVRDQHAGRMNPASIPPYLLDPTWVPGVPGAQKTDPTIGVDFEEVVARFKAAA